MYFGTNNIMEFSRRFLNPWETELITGLGYFHERFYNVFFIDFSTDGSLDSIPDPDIFTDKISEIMFKMFPFHNKYKINRYFLEKIFIGLWSDGWDFEYNFCVGYYVEVVSPSGRKYLFFFSYIVTEICEDAEVLGSSALFSDFSALVGSSPVTFLKRDSVGLSNSWTDVVKYDYWFFYEYCGAVGRYFFNTPWAKFGGEGFREIESFCLDRTGGYFDSIYINGLNNMAADFGSDKMENERYQVDLTPYYVYYDEGIFLSGGQSEFEKFETAENIELKTIKLLYEEFQRSYLIRLENKKKNDEKFDYEIIQILDGVNSKLNVQIKENDFVVNEYVITVDGLGVEDIKKSFDGIEFNILWNEIYLKKT